MYFFFVETQGPTLEELALIFDDPPTGDSKDFKADTTDARLGLQADGDVEKRSMTVDLREKL